MAVDVGSSSRVVRGDTGQARSTSALPCGGASCGRRPISPASTSTRGQRVWPSRTADTLPILRIAGRAIAYTPLAPSTGGFTLGTGPNAVTECFARCFARARIEDAFHDDIAHRSGRGLDRVDARAFGSDLATQVEVIHRKVLDGTYEFTPYLEQLRPKGREKPRVVSVSTVRDRIVLVLLKDFLHAVFAHFVARHLPNAVIRRLCATLRDVGVARHAKEAAGMYDELVDAMYKDSH